MKALVLTLLVLCAAAPARAVELDYTPMVYRLAYVIAQIETGGHWNGVAGRAGELSDWQITREVWIQELPGVPFSSARLHGAAKACAVMHLRRIIGTLQAHGHSVTPARVATAWNIGVTGLLRRHCKPTDYGDRAAALYYAP